MKVTVKIKPEIAVKGSGFYDLEGKQDIFPPRGKDGKPVINHEFTVESTSFVEAKIASQELVLVAREEAVVIYEVFLGSEKMTEIQTGENAQEDEIFELILKTDEAKKSGLKDKNVKSYQISGNKIEIVVK